MYGINMFAIMTFAAINILSLRLCKCPAPTRTRAIRSLCIVLLGFVVGRDLLILIDEHRINVHVEFSSVAYFAVPAILLLGRKKLMGWAAYSGLIAGLFYYLTMMISGGAIYQNYPPVDIYISMFCHGSIFLCGFVTASTHQCEASDRHVLLGGIAFVGLHAYVLRPFVKIPGRIFIYELMDGDYVKQLLPQGLWGTALPVYYVLLAAFLVLSVIGFARLNRARVRRYNASMHMDPLSA